jgi:hypothetical protein
MRYYYYLNGFFSEKSHSAPKWYLCMRQYTFLWAVALVSGTNNLHEYRGANRYGMPVHKLFFIYMLIQNDKCHFFVY